MTRLFTALPIALAAAFFALEAPAQNFVPLPMPGPGIIQPGPGFGGPGFGGPGYGGPGYGGPGYGAPGYTNPGLVITLPPVIIGGGVIK